jgi:hypothetical protein
MPMHRSAMLLVLAPLAIGFAPAPLPPPDPGKADLKKLQGEWDGPGQVAVVVAGARMKYVDASGLASEWTISLHFTAGSRSFKLKRLSGEGGDIQGSYDLKPGALLVYYYPSATTEGAAPVPSCQCQPRLLALKRRRR